jgi:hypothetical protein
MLHRESHEWYVKGSGIKMGLGVVGQPVWLELKLKLNSLAWATCQMSLSNYTLSKSVLLLILQLIHYWETVKGNMFHKWLI